MLSSGIIYQQWNYIFITFVYSPPFVAFVCHSHVFFFLSLSRLYSLLFIFSDWDPSSVYQIIRLRHNGSVDTLANGLPYHTAS